MKGTRKTPQRLKVIIVILGMMLGMTVATPAQADTGGYPYADATMTSSGTWGYVECKAFCGYFEYVSGTKYYYMSERGYAIRNCTDYVAWKLQSLGVSNSKTSGLGNGGQWAASADGRAGVSIDSTPTAGSAAIMVGNPGHVAFVESVNSNGTITISEYNYGYTGNYNVRTGTAAAMGFTKFVNFGVSPTPPVATPVDDFIIYRSSGGTGYWYAKRNEGGVATSYLVNGWTHGGQAGDIPFTADFTGDKVADFGIYRAGSWYVEDGVTHNPTAIWGAVHGGPGDTPVAGDFNGDEYADFGIYRLVNGSGTWYVKSGSTGQQTAIWGATHGSPGDVPIVGDFNGDRIADFGIYRASGSAGYWYVKSSANGQPISSAWGVIQGGWAQDTPIAGDFNGDGYADFGIYRPDGGTGFWYARSGVNTSTVIVDGATHGGWTGDVPLAGNFG